MSEETVDNVRFSLGRFDRYLSQLRRQLQWFSAESSESRESRRIPKCLEAISLPQVISASELPMPKAISELVAELVTGLTGFDSLEKEEGQLEELRHRSAS